VASASGCGLVITMTVSQTLHLTFARAPFILVSSILYFFPQESQLISIIAPGSFI
jgi:hypothetical protein